MSIEHLQSGGKPLPTVEISLGKNKFSVLDKEGNVSTNEWHSHGEKKLTKGLRVLVAGPGTYCVAVVESVGSDPQLTSKQVDYMLAQDTYEVVLLARGKEPGSKREFTQPEIKLKKL